MTDEETDKQETPAEPSVRELIRARLGLILALGAIGAVAGFAGAELVGSDKYETEAVMFFQESPVSAALTNSQWVQTPATNPELGDSATVENQKPIFEATAEELDVDEGAVRDVIGVEPDLEEERVIIVATDSDPDRAAEYANAFATTFVAEAEEFDESEIEAALERSEATLEELPPDLVRSRPGKDVRDQIARLKALEVTGTDRIDVLERAEVPDEPVASIAWRSVITGGLAGLLLGLAIACWPLLRRSRDAVQPS
jgi:capsular polysaccharide biosynthesis protein